MNSPRFLIALATLVLGPWFVMQASAAKPNFIVILMDDMGYGDVEPFGSKLNRTPQLNKMAAEGMKLTSFYAATVCTPSRAQMMTGCYAKRVSMPKVIGPSCPTGLSTNEKTVARLLKDLGYATMCIGKWHLGDQSEFLPTRHGFDHYLGLPYSNDMGAEGGKGVKAGTNPPLPLLKDAKVVEAPAVQDKLTKLYTEEAIKFITAHKDIPFFLYFPHTAVHTPINPGKEFAGKSANGRYGDWVEEVDWSVGQVLKTVRDLKLDSNTMVIFTSDNGPWLIKGKDGGVAGPLRGGKASCWEGGLRVPTIAWWPDKIPAGSSCAAMTSEMDILPTLVGLAGGKVPTDRKIDGMDLWPILSGKSKDSPHDALYYFSKDGNLEAVRSGHWKLFVKKPSGGKGSPKNPNPALPVLYNLDQDLGENTDVADKNPDVVKKMLGLIDRMDKDLGVQRKGPGVRPCGSVSNPKPLIMDGKEYN
jgi:arylsulfatase A-like enzyme